MYLSKSGTIFDKACLMFFMVVMTILELMMMDRNSILYEILRIVQYIYGSYVTWNFNDDVFGSNNSGNRDYDIRSFKNAVECINSKLLYEFLIKLNKFLKMLLHKFQIICYCNF